MKVKEFKKCITNIDANYDDYDLEINFTTKDKSLLVNNINDVCFLNMYSFQTLDQTPISYTIFINTLNSIEENILYRAVEDDNFE